MLVGGLGALVLPFWLSVPLGLLLGGALAGWWLRTADDRVLRAVGATPVATGDEPRLRNLVDGLCISNGIPIPQLSTVDSPALNCLAVGRSRQRTTLVFTRGMLDSLDRIQLEGVVARLLAQVKQGETQLATVLTPLGGVAPGLVTRALPARYDVAADLDAVGLTRYPPGLAAALERTRGNSHVARAPRSTSALWFDEPFPAGDPAGSVHSPIDERIATLQEL